MTRTKTLDRDTRIRQAIITYPTDAKRNKDGYPDLWALRRHAKLPNITYQERNRIHYEVENELQEALDAHLTHLRKSYITARVEAYKTWKADDVESDTLIEASKVLP